MNDGISTDSNNRGTAPPAFNQIRADIQVNAHVAGNGEEALRLRPNYQSPATSLGHSFPYCAAYLTFSDYVELLFGPHYVANRRISGQAHFQAILRHIITPERVQSAFRLNAGKTRTKLRTIPGWPYIGHLQLCEISVEDVQRLVSYVLEQGYSTQTALHIKNVVRSVYSHAHSVIGYSGENPATPVVIRAVVQHETSPLSLDRLQQVIRLMRYPAREAALLAVFTNMNMCEICGLQWTHVNLSEVRRMVNSEWIPARCIAVRNQIYRCNASYVMENRRRVIRITDLLHSILSNVKDERSVTGEEYVLTARNGSPISQCNLAARSLKTIGSSVGIDRLTWLVFQRTGQALRDQLGTTFESEMRRAIPLERLIRRPVRQNLPPRGSY